MDKAILSDFSNAKIIVVGDVMLDRYWFGDSTRLSPEAPVPVVVVETIRDTAGGAANVAMNVANLGAQAEIFSVLGRDQEGEILRTLLETQNVTCRFVQHDLLKTIVKLRLIVRNQHIVRADFERKPDLEQLLPVVNMFRTTLRGDDTVIFSDYGKGGLGHVSEMLQFARNMGVKVLIDPKGADYSAYRGANVMTPNRAEFAQVAGHWSSEADFERRAFALRDQLELEALLVTRSEEGMSLFINGRHVYIQAQAREVFDVSGAGDTVIAVLGTALGAGFELEHAARLANAAASIVVGKLGTYPITLKELNASL
jgi:rfaE bifunctional protein kinase chain/domain